MYCAAYIKEVNPGGGKIVSMLRGAVWTGKGDFVLESQALANQNCLSRGFSNAYLSPPVRLPDLMIYRQTQEFTCINNLQEPIVPRSQHTTNPAPQHSNPQNRPRDLDEITIEKAREKCKDLGFKENTENFGNCVLKLMR